MRTATLTNTATKGVLDPALSDRIDLKHYYDGLESALNVECTPQGGVRRRAGTTAAQAGKPVQRLRRRSVPIVITTEMLTVSNGGTAANLIDQSDASSLVTDAVDAATFVVASLDLGAAQDIVFVDVTSFSCAADRWPDALAVEYWDGSAWVEFAPAGRSARRELSTLARTRRWGLRPGLVVSADQWRIVVYGATGAGTISVGGLRVWRELGTTSTFKEFSFARTSDLVYEGLLTERNIDVFRDGVWWAAAPIDVDFQQIDEVVITQSEENAFFYHEDVHTPWLQQQGGNDEWNVKPAPYTNVPSIAGASFAGDQDEVQDVDFGSMQPGDTFQLWLGPTFSAPFTFDPDTIVTTLEGWLPSGVSVSLLSATLYRVRFAGAAGARAWPLLSVVPTSGSARSLTTIVQRGLHADGAMFGATTGWPRCGIFYQERHLVCGFRGNPSGYGWSVYGDELDFTDEGDPLTADLALFGKLNTDRLETIHQVAIGRNVHLLTESGEWYMEARTIDATQPNNVTLATGNGCKSAVQPIFSDGATLFVQKGGRVLRELVCSDVELAYTAQPLNLLGPHLLTDVVAMAHRPSRNLNEGNQLFCVNADGSLAFATLLKGQEVVAFAPWAPARSGLYRGVLADPLLRVWVIVERTASGVTDLFLQKLDGSHTLDDAVIYDQGGAATTVIVDLDHLEGEDVWAWIDSELVGPLKVYNGEVNLPVPGSRVVVGLFPPLRGRLPRIREKLQNERPWRPPARIYEAGLSLAGTGQIDIAVNGGPFRDVPLTFDGSRALDIAAEPPRDTSNVDAQASIADAMEQTIRAIDMIPGSGEFVYAGQVIERTDTETGQVVRLNMHNTTGDPDFLVSIGQMKQALTNVANVSLFTTWFGSDLRAGACVLKPKVDQPAGDLFPFTYAPYDWSVAGIARADAELVSIAGGEPVYGGTPADQSVVEGIQALKAHGIAVTFTPFIIMDIPAGNANPDPYGGAEQAAHPWRGRITCYPAPGRTGSVDLSASAANQVANFVGTCAVSDFAIDGETVTYSGPDEWSYRRFVLHYAHLCKAAGGIDTFVIGSEMRGLTWVRSALGVYPFVNALVTLAAEVKSLLGAATKVTYAADWSEFVPHQTPAGGGEIFFHLDPLWSSASIDAVGMDNYWPLSDWRDGEGHLDMLAGTRYITERPYLQGNIAGGEGYDWFYASSGDRATQTRTAITDGYGKPWVWRFKDIKSWWSNSHYNRPAGVESATATEWLPQAKPIWFMEIGCPAVNKGTNQPNVFYDPKSSESFLPYYSNGVQDVAIQRAYIEALTGYFTPGQTGWSEANNPVSTVDGRRMVDHGRIYVYCWDARFFPAFPELDSVWGDGELYRLGHWITGRVRIVDRLASDTLPVGLSPELPMRDRLITGTVRITNLRGWSRHPSFEFSQRKPAPLEIRAIRLELAYRG
jgi:hypothetical protein